MTFSNQPSQEKQCQNVLSMHVQEVHTPSGHSWRFARSLKGRCRLIEWRLCCCYCKAIKRSRRLAGWGSHAWPAVAVSQHELRQKLANTRIHTWIEIERHYAKAAHKFIWLTCVILKRRVERVFQYTEYSISIQYQKLASLIKTSKFNSQYF